MIEERGEQPLEEPREDEPRPDDKVEDLDVDEGSDDVKGGIRKAGGDKQVDY